MSVIGTGWDCHAHVFGPYEHYPLAAGRSYTPPEATTEDFLSHLGRLGMAHGVLVHPSAYGTDASLLFDALERHSLLRGVMVARANDEVDWKRLRQRGVRGLRFSARNGAADFAGSASFDDLVALAPRMADAGIHAELWTDCRMLPSMERSIQHLPVPVVIDHMGGFDVGAGVADPGFQALLRLLSSSKAWVKLCVYRNLPAYPELDGGKVFHEALLTANPHRLLWGSDWPHLRMSPVPEALALLDTCRSWTADADVERQILIDNPASLYR